MQQDVWSREDLRNAILATYYAGVVAPPDASSATSQAYQAYVEGFRAALASLALFIGLPPVVLPQRQRSHSLEDVGVRLVGK